MWDPEFCETIPCAAVVTDFAGRIVTANRRAFELLQIDGREAEGLVLSDLIAPATTNPESGLTVTAGSASERGESLLATTRSRRYVRRFTHEMPPQDSDHGELTLCLLIDVDTEERLQLLFREVPIGLYELDEGSRIIAVNRTILEMFGYDNADQMLRKPVEKFYARREDQARVAAEASGPVGMQGEMIPFVRQDGNEFYGRVYAKQVFLGGKPLGRNGAILDVTEEERHRRIFKDAPLGFYTVGLNTEGEEIITECNEAFAHMFDFEGPADVRNTKIATLYDSAKDYDRFRKLLESQDRLGEPLIGAPLKVRSMKNRRFTIDVYCKPLHASFDEERIVGRIGLVRKTEEYEMQGLIKDIGRILHPYTGVLQMMQHTLSSVEETLVDILDASDLPPHPSDHTEVLKKLVDRLLSHLHELLGLREGDRAGAFSPRTWELIELRERQLATYEKEIPFPELFPSALRGLGLSVSHTMGAAGRGIPRELLRAIRESARRLQVAATRAEIQTTRALVAEAGHQALTLREYIISRVKPPAPRTSESLDSLIRQAIEQNSGFASDQGVSIRQGREYDDVCVTVAHAAVVRALSNLLHNAIKYSWERQKGTERWVEIRCFTDGDDCVVEFENFGVLIPPDEIQSGSIFAIGHRGRLSYETGRLGSGIGLADALAVARDHCGDISIESSPVVEGTREGRTGAKTTVTFRIRKE